MNFEKFLLDNYLQTKEGKGIYKLFNQLLTVLQNDPERFLDFIDSLLNMPLAKTFYGIEIKADGLLPEMAELTSSNGYKSINEFCDALKFTDMALARFDQGEIPNNSVRFFLDEPEFSFPYLFPCHFYKFKEICNTFDIPIPELPSKIRHLDRCNYYFTLCKVMYEFRKEYNLTPVELCVFLYGFAVRFTNNYIKEELPPANKVYIVGATKEDVENYLSGDLLSNEITVWQGNSEMLPGDIVIVYETTPYSRIGSIWRAISPGFDDPFHYFPGKVFLSHPQKVPYISFQEISNNPIWKNKGLVKAHMQGVNGRTCSIDEYEELKKMLLKKGLNPSLFPVPPPYAQFYNEDLQNERDVEKNLLEPFLLRIGYKTSEWIRQLPIRMGRGFRYYPDYALHSTGERNETKAEFIWEAKYRISTNKQLREDFGQAKSYALRLQAFGFGLVSIEGIWISSGKDNFNIDKIIYCSWEDLKTPDRFGEIRILLRKLCLPK